MRLPRVRPVPGTMGDLGKSEGVMATALPQRSTMASWVVSCPTFAPESRVVPKSSLTRFLSRVDAGDETLSRFVADPKTLTGFSPRAAAVDETLSRFNVAAPAGLPGGGRGPKARPVI